MMRRKFGKDLILSRIWNMRLAIRVIVSHLTPAKLTRFFLSPLCIEEFDLSDRNFRPCPCGYQVRVDGHCSRRRVFLTNVV
jgi:hypothetical protein